MRCDGSIYDVILFVALRDISPDAELFFEYVVYYLILSLFIFY